MRLLLVSILLLGPPRPTKNDTVLERLKLSYCSARYAIGSQDATSTVEARAHAKAFADTLFPFYQRALQVSKGTMVEIALQDEAAKAKAVAARDLSTAEFFMITEGCERLVHDASLR